MSGVMIETRVQGIDPLAKALLRMHALGQRPGPIWHAIGQYGESSTRLRFARQVGPDGQRWKPSKRALKTGGQTLRLKGHLLASISYRASNRGAEWGSNRVYAGIHQFGGTINKLAFSSTLRLRTRRGGALLRQKDHANLAVFARKSHKQAVERRYTVGAHAITMPARPFLGVNDEDGREIVRLGEAAVDLVARNRGGTP